MHFLKTTLILFLIARTGGAMAQGHQQTVRGTVLDSDTRQPLFGATVIVVDSDPMIGTTTDLDGRFTMNEVPVGRVALQVRMLGYEEQLLTNLLLNSAKELVLEIKMQGSLVQLEEVVISGKKGHGEVRNDMAMLSAQDQRGGDLADRGRHQRSGAYGHHILRRSERSRG